MPTLFADFPLIGSESFKYPCYINSHLFYPNEPRSSILLAHSTHANLNKKILVEIVELYTKIFDSVTGNHWEEIESLVEFEIPLEVDRNWYK